MKLMRFIFSIWLRKKNPFLKIVHRKHEQQKNQEQERLMIINQKKFSKEVSDVKAV